MKDKPHPVSVVKKIWDSTLHKHKKKKMQSIKQTLDHINQSSIWQTDVFMHF